jgi:hypothetical protein
MHKEGEGCPAARGWSDPTGSDGGALPTYVDDGNGQQRVCDLRQLDGESGQRCRSGADCTDCLSGFCRETTTSPICPAGTYPPQLRFIGGALLGSSLVHVRITCLLEP